MIIFDLDALADDSHRRHLIDLSKNPNYEKNYYINRVEPPFMEWCHKETGEVWQSDYEAYNEACDKDKPIWPVLRLINRQILREEDVLVWSARFMFEKDKTITWLKDWLDVDQWFYRDCLRMRPTEDTRPKEKLFENWYDLHNVESPRDNVDFVFSSDAPTIAMFRRRGIFVFDCNQESK